MDRITVMMKLSCRLRGYYTLLMGYIGWRVFVFAVGGEIEQHKAGPAIQNRGSKSTVAAQ